MISVGSSNPLLLGSSIVASPPPKVLVEGAHSPPLDAQVEEEQEEEEEEENDDADKGKDVDDEMLVDVVVVVVIALASPRSSASRAAAAAEEEDDKRRRSMTRALVFPFALGGGGERRVNESQERGRKKKFHSLSLPLCLSSLAAGGRDVACKRAISISASLSTESPPTCLDAVPPRLLKRQEKREKKRNIKFRSRLQKKKYAHHFCRPLLSLAALAFTVRERSGLGQ